MIDLHVTNKGDQKSDSSDDLASNRFNVSCRVDTGVVQLKTRHNTQAFLACLTPVCGSYSTPPSLPTADHALKLARIATRSRRHLFGKMSPCQAKGGWYCFYPACRWCCLVVRKSLNIMTSLLKETFCQLDPKVHV